MGFFGFSGLSCTYGMVTLTMAFTTNKGTAGYDTAFSIDNLGLAEHNNKLSVRLFLSGQTDSSISVGIDTQCASKLIQIYVRYLVVVPPLIGPVNLVYFTQDFTGGTVLNGTTDKVTLSKSIALVANQTKSAVFLMGFNIENTRSSSNFIDLYCNEILSDSGVTVDITTIDTNHVIYLYHISFTVVTVKYNFNINSAYGTFEVVNGLNNYGGSSWISSPASSTTVYSDSTTFLGIRAFKNRESSHGLYFNFAIISTRVTFQTTTNQSPVNCFSISFINFVFPPSCNTSTPYLLLLNSTCYTSCPASFFASNGSFTCDNCSTSCLTCSLAATNCTSCLDKFYLYNSNCLPCPDQCLLCTSPTVCTSCIANYNISNATCVVDCSSISQCSLCTLVSSRAYCMNCSVNYIVEGGGCVGKCGDGVVVTGEGCDDGNLQDNDGCSSSCKQEAYFSCTSATAGATSTCSLSGIGLEYDYTIKVKTGNAFTSYFKVTPNIQMMKVIKWIDGVSFTNQGITAASCNYDASTGKLSITSSYSEDFSSNTPVQFSFNYGMMSNLLTSIPASTHSQSLVTQNNLALQYYSDSTYQLAAFIQYFSLLLAGIAWLMLLAGYACGKLIVLEHIAVLQVAYLCLQTVHEASPAF
jgi:cysteine-rich repeat protein